MKKKVINSSRMPVYRDAGFELFDADTAKEAFERETENERIPELYIYSRYRNPTVIVAEEEIMKLEGCKWALLTQSGMSAIDTALSIFQTGASTKPWLFFSEIYGGTISYTESVLKIRRGLEIHNFSPENERYDLGEFRKLVNKVRPGVVYAETISNPMLIVSDIEEIIKIAHGSGAKVIVDNTFATPALYRPLDSGADIVIHSATKYFSGHGDITAGVLCGNDPNLMKAAIEYRKLIGHMLSADDAYRLNEQVRTFRLRFREQCSNAVRLVKILEEDRAVDKIWYPGLPDHPTHAEAVKLFGSNGFGAMITFELSGETDQERKLKRDRFIKDVSGHIKLIPSLGDPETILMPVSSVWAVKYPYPGMIRLSIGFEDYKILQETITKAFS